MLFSVSLGPLCLFMYVSNHSHTVSVVYYASLGDDSATSIYFLDPRIVLRHSHSSPWGEHSRENRVKVIRLSIFLYRPNFHLCSVYIAKHTYLYLNLYVQHMHSYGCYNNNWFHFNIDCSVCNASGMHGV